MLQVQIGQLSYRELFVNNACKFMFTVNSNGLTIILFTAHLPGQRF